MKNVSIIIFTIALLGVCLLLVLNTSQDELPEDYLPFTLYQFDDKLEGSSEYLEGFKISMDISRELLEDGLNIDTIFSLIRNQTITGTVTYPDGRTTQIQYEIVRHRDSDDIYMKSSLGYFLWEYISVEDDALELAIYWWYCPPATEVDLEILDMAEQLLADPDNWHQNDDRECTDDIESNRWSLFCALKYASIEKMGEYNHHNTAMQTVRFLIDDLVPNHGYEHTLMDYNNASSTKHIDILNLLKIAQEQIRQEIDEG